MATAMFLRVTAGPRTYVQDQKTVLLPPLPSSPRRWALGPQGPQPEPSQEADLGRGDLVRGGGTARPQASLSTVRESGFQLHLSLRGANDSAAVQAQREGCAHHTISRRRCLEADRQKVGADLVRLSSVPQGDGLTLLHSHPRRLGRAGPRVCPGTCGHQEQKPGATAHVASWEPQGSRGARHRCSLACPAPSTPEPRPCLGGMRGGWAQEEQGTLWWRVLRPLLLGLPALW